MSTDPAASFDKIRQDLDDVLLPGERKYSFANIAEISGVELDRLTELWQTVGFATPADVNETAYTQGDLESIVGVAAVLGAGVVDENTVMAAARALGQSLSRIAEWQAPIVEGFLDQMVNASQKSGNDSYKPGIEAIVEQIVRIQTQIWRRHLASYTREWASSTTDTPTATMAVGFADMVGYTRLSRGLEINELKLLLEVFESTVTSVILNGGGWVIKNVGDEVMFAADNARDAARIGLRLQSVERNPAALRTIDIEMPELRVGIAYGSVLTRFGDVYGDVVNLAARLTSGARPGTVLVDAQLAARVAGDAQLQTKALRPYRARGISAVHAHLLRWT